MSKKNKKNTCPPTQKAPLPFVETLTGSPRREGFDISKWRMAIKQAEDPRLPNRSLLYDIYNDILIDSHLTAVIEKREDAITGTSLTFSDKDDPIAELIEMPWFEDFLKDILNAKFWGYSAMWVDLATTQFNNYKLLPRKNINPCKGIFLNKPEDKEGASYTNPPYCHYVVTAGKEDDLGLILKAVPWVLLKRGDVSDWATFNELFASPFRKGTYQMGTPGKEELIKALQNAGGMAWAAIPSDCTLDFIQNQASGSTQAYQALAEFCDKQVSKLFLGNTLTTDAEGGQYKGDIHAQSEKGKFASDRRFVLNILNTHFIHLLDAHGFNPEGTFKFVVEDNIPLSDRLEMDLKLSEKVEVPVEYWYSKYNLPLPEKGAKAMGEVSPAPVESKAKEDKPKAKEDAKPTTKQSQHGDKASPFNRIKSFFD
ncbi:MAG: DUF935 family protein [Bacteroidales bacterium]